MNWRTTLILAVVVLAVFAYLRFFEMKQPSTGEARRQAQNVVNFDRNKIDGVVIQNGDEKIEIRRHDNKWRLETPFKDQADGA
jgi:lipopolysaccharide export system protein LptC